MNLLRGQLLWRLAVAFGGILVTVTATSRVSAAEFELIVEALELEPGTTVADVGAGGGDWVVKLAQFVGKKGHVWATEVDDDEIENIEDEVLDAFLNNVTVVLGDQSGSGLPPSCCDAILLRLVYHHFIQPYEMRADLLRALRPRGLIAVVDVTPQSSWRELPEVPDRGGHGIEPEDLIREMTSAGFEVVSRQDNWNGDEDRYCVVFRR